MLNLNRFLFLIVFILGFQFPAFAQNDAAANNDALKIKNLTRGADIIVTGKVTKKTAGWNDNKTRIYTKTTLQVDEVLKGNSRGTAVEITYPGGEVDGIGELYTHTATFEKDEEVLVFLKKDEKSQGYKVLNGEEGKITVPRDTKTKEKTSSSDMQIDDLKSQIKSYIKNK